MAKHVKQASPEFLGFQAAGPRWLFWAGLAWAALVLWVYGSHCPSFGVPFLSVSAWAAAVPPVWKMSSQAALQHGSHLFWLALFVAFAAALGRGLLRGALKIGGLNGFESFGFSFGLGFTVISLATFILAALQLLRPPFVFGLSAAAAALAWRLNLSRASSGEDAVEPRVGATGPRVGATGPRVGATGPRVGAAEVRPLGGAACKVLAVVAALMLLLDLFYALAPEIFFDALVYHLALPQAYRLHGGLFATANNMFSGFPMLMEGAYAFMLFFSDEISAKLIHWACCLGASSALIGIGLRCRRPLAGWAACVAFLATPVMIYNVVKTAVDVGSAFFALLAVQALALHLARKPEEADKASLLTLSALLCGAAMGVKYTNWVLLPVTALALLSVGESKRSIGRYGAIAVALIVPFVLKNIVFYRDPIYPFFHEFFARGAEFVAPWRSLSTDAGGGRDWGAILGHGDALLRTLLHPWFITVDGFGEPNHVGPLFLMALPALLWLRPAAPESKLWMRTILGLWLCWWPVSGWPRFFLPGLCLLSVFVGVAAASYAGRASVLLAALLAGLSFDAAAGFVQMMNETGSMTYLLGGVSKEDYLRQTRPVNVASDFNAVEWINQHAPPGSRVLVLSGGRTAYLRRPSLASTALDEDLLAHWVKKSRSAQDLLARFQENGITHLLANMAWVWTRKPDQPMSADQVRVLDQFLDRYARVAYADVAPPEQRWALVYEIGAADPSRRTPRSLVEWYRVGGVEGLNGRPIQVDVP